MFYLPREENILWDDQKRSTEDYPKPDFTYGYTINNDIPVSLRSTEIVTNFSLEVLGDLRSAGLISSPIRGLREWAKDKATSLSQDQLICFPFAVVELRPCGISFLSENESCYSQAANGALAALRLNEKLCNWATASYDSVPPVVAFTCVGEEIRVWLAFSEVKDNIHLSRVSSAPFGCIGFILVLLLISIHSHSIEDGVHLGKQSVFRLGCSQDLLYSKKYVTLGIQSMEAERFRSYQPNTAKQNFVPA